MDDIQYLMEHGQMEEYLFVVDSNNRDRTIYPKPSNYSVTFRDPFYNVFGCDVIEITVPKSGYVINSRNNVLRFRFTDAEWLALNGTAWITVTIAEGNHDPTSLITELNKQLNMSSRVIEVQSVSSPFDVRNQFIYLSEYPFEFDTSSTVKQILGFNEVLVLNSKSLVSYNIRYMTDLVPIVGSFEGSSNTDDGFPISQNRFLQQYFTAKKAGYLAGLELYIIPFGNMTGISETIDYRIIHGRTSRTIVTGTLDVAAVGNYTKLRLDQVNQDPDDPFEITDVYYLELYDADNPDINNGWRVTHGPKPANYGTLFMTQEGVREVFYERDHVLNMNVYIHPIKHALIPPGIVNLTGSGYIQLRCPELETNMYRGRMYEATNVGLAFIKISKLIDFNERYSSNQTPQRKFHPITRLNRLTFIFQNPDGSEHDFKGVDHTIVLLLKYLTAPAAKYTMRALNPRYNPNPIEYARKGELRDDDS